MPHGDYNWPIPFSGNFIGETWGGGGVAGGTTAHDADSGGGGGGYARSVSIALVFGNPDVFVRVGAPGGSPGAHESLFGTVPWAGAYGGDGRHGGGTPYTGPNIGAVIHAGGDGDLYDGTHDTPGRGGGSSATRNADGTPGTLPAGGIAPDNTGGNGGTGSAPGNGDPPPTGDSLPGGTGDSPGGGGASSGCGINGNPGARGIGGEGCVLIWEDVGVWPPVYPMVPVGIYGTPPAGAIPTVNAKTRKSVSMV